MKFDGVIIGVVRRELVMSLLRENICEVVAPLRYDKFSQLSGLGNLGGNSGLVELLSFQPGLLFVQSVGDLLVHIKASPLQEILLGNIVKGWGGW